ncbi:TonB-dependent receptor [Dasania marina]|uniref:TonB-dependent receptor n=1 Tax=Dasania marina TaxID=471499 RepID=UPI0030D84DF7|tara:strand:- start:79699 stop:82041 length:2343 start_codon:yes stop_codon:yes gene_type:complete
MKVVLNKKPLSAAVTGVVLASGMLAQAAQAIVLEEVMVTATKRAVSAQEIPYNISALSGDDLQDQGVSDLSKLTRSIPGVSYVDTGPRNAGVSSGLIIRGLNANPLGPNDSINNTSDPVSTYLGDMPLFVNLQLKDIERVEVLRGPQGTLYGSGSLGGTIRYIHKEPDVTEFSAEVNTRISNTKGSSGLNSDTDIVANIPLNNDMAIRIGGGYVDNQGFVDAVGRYALDANGKAIATNPGDVANSPAKLATREDVNDNSVTHARASFLWDASEEVKILANYFYQKDEVGGRQVGSPQIAGGDDYSHLIPLDEDLESEVNAWSVDVEVELGFASFTSSTSAYDYDSLGQKDNTQSYINDFSDYYGNFPRWVVAGSVDYQREGLSQEFRLTSAGDSDIDWVAGLYYTDTENNLSQQDSFPGYNEWAAVTTDPVAITGGPANELAYSLDQKLSFEEKAAFGEITYHITDAWQMTGGARFFRQTVGSDTTTLLPYCGTFCSNDNINPLGLVEAELERDLSDSIFKFNTSYDLNDDIMVYFTWAEGFRHGGANALPTAGNFAEDARLNSFDADKATNWEVGVKGVLFERVEFTASLFYIDWQDIIINTTSPVAAFPVAVNGDEAVSQGLELEAKYYFTQETTITLGYGYVDAELSKDFSVLGVLGGNKGDQLPGVPEHSAMLALDHFQDLDNGIELKYHVNASYRDEITTSLTEGSADYAVLDSYAILDASLTLRKDQWKATVFIDNLTDERAEVGHRTEARYGDGAFDYVNRPRTAGVGLAYTF